MNKDALLEKWAAAPDVPEIMSYLRERIARRQASGRDDRDEIRSETAVWLAEVMSRDRSAESVLRHQLDTAGEWRLQLHPNFTTHRGRLGRILVWVKRRLLYPPLRWIVEVVEVNAWRQDRMNASTLNLLEEMALEIGRLRAKVDRLSGEIDESRAAKPGGAGRTAP